MVSLSNTAFLLSHMRNCFITGDDTGVSEMIIDKQKITSEELQSMLYDDDYSLPIKDTESETFQNESPEIVFNETNSLRPMSITETRVMERKKEKQMQNQTEKIDLSTAPPKQLTTSEIDSFFPVKPADEIAKSAEKLKIRKSTLSTLLEQATLLPQNPFTEYARYCSPSNAPHLRRFNVYFWDLPECERSKYITVFPIMETTVAQFIGLCLYLYTNAGRKPQLKKSMLNTLEVYMFEDLDDLDTDFPPLERTDRVLRYEFTTLALVDRGASKEIDQNKVKTNDEVSDDTIVVTIYMAVGSSKQQFTLNTKLSEVLTRAMKKRNLREQGGNEYKLERYSRPGQAVDINATLAEIGEAEFSLVRENSRREPLDVENVSGDSDMLASLLLKQYKVVMKSVLSREVVLSVSVESIEISRANKSKTFISNKSPRTIPIDLVGSCELVGTQDRPSGKALFRLEYLQTSTASGLSSSGYSITPDQRLASGDSYFTSQLYEAPQQTVKDICKQVNHILYFRGSKVRQVYLEREGRKTKQQKVSST